MKSIRFFHAFACCAFVAGIAAPASAQSNPAAGKLLLVTAEKTPTTTSSLTGQLYTYEVDSNGSLHFLGSPQRSGLATKNYFGADVNSQGDKIVFFGEQKTSQWSTSVFEVRRLSDWNLEQTFILPPTPGLTKSSFLHRGNSPDTMYTDNYDDILSLNINDGSSTKIGSITGLRASLGLPLTLPPPSSAVLCYNENTNTAYASLPEDSLRKLYAVNLSTGQFAAVTESLQTGWTVSYRCSPLPGSNKVSVTYALIGNPVGSGSGYSTTSYYGSFTHNSSTGLKGTIVPPSQFLYSVSSVSPPSYQSTGVKVFDTVIAADSSFATAIEAQNVSISSGSITSSYNPGRQIIYVDGQGHLAANISIPSVWVPLVPTFNPQDIANLIALP